MDDLEYSRRDDHKAVFQRYRTAMHGALKDDQTYRASVHFLVYMLEAYYFAHAAAINQTLDLGFSDHDGDVEAIRNPKGRLRELSPGFDEIEDGRRIVELLDMDHVLSNPATCGSLRTLVKWCIAARRGEPTDRYQCRNGACSPVTGTQLAELPER